MENFMNIYTVPVAVALATVSIWVLKGVLYRKLYTMYSAWILNRLTVGLDRAYMRHKKRLFQIVEDYKNRQHGDLKILELGVGAAPNLKYVPDNSEITLLDPNPYLKKHAEENIVEARKRLKSVEWVQGVAADIPSPSNTFDIVCCTLVLCSVVDIKKCLSEIHRVLKPGGMFVFVEHVAAEKNTWKRLVQTFMDPVHYVLYDKCSVIRETETYIRASSLTDIKIERFHANLYYWVTPSIAGTATK
ncbi:hypothetical protein ACF0H5_013643 [Mactra antiquata]